MTVDISVRGAGIFGLSIAWSCVQRGARVELVDPCGVGTGASGGIVGALAPHVPENWNPKKQFQFESLLRAETFWREVDEISGLSSGYVRAGRVQPIEASAIELAHARGEGAKELWQSQALWQVTEDPLGWDIPSPSGQYIHDTLSAHIHPRRACASLAAALAAKGVECVPESNKTAGAVLWATGAAGLDELSAGHTRLVGQGIKGQAALLQCDRTGLPQLFAQTLHIIPHVDGTVAVGSTTEREYLNPSATDQKLDEVIEHARRVLPELADAPVIQRWAGLRPRARSRAPMLGPWPDRAGQYVANGGFKIGFGMAPKVADVMTDLLLEGRNRIPEGFEVAASL